MCYLVLCEASFPKKLAFAYLEDLQAEFHEQHGKRVPTVSRPYSFIEFGEITTGGRSRGGRGVPAHFQTSAAVECIHTDGRSDEDCEPHIHKMFFCLCLSDQTPTSRKPRNPTSTAEPEGIWAASTRSSRTFRGLWWQTLKRCCREERRSLVSPGWGSLEVNLLQLYTELYDMPVSPPPPLQHSTPKPATCPACLRSTGVTPST